ncbi:MAG: hypothetical protein GF317_14550 [Candidatus Lokiarchaeota archaeon]|nr:hypothetical protein [Candidatus Lokiarchaeota archaeon]MBD3200827.1 hypothetical protein [Candidatus Lokiarchaeota archaeon]
MNNTTSAPNDQKQTVDLPLLDFFKINFISFLVPLYACLALFLLFEYGFIIPFSIPLVFHLFLLPFLFLILYYIYLIILIEFSALWVKFWNKKSPPVQGVFERVLSDMTKEEGKMIKYYHKRGFIIKFPMWLTAKSPFPWLINRTLRRIGHNKIGKNVIYTDNYVGLEFTEIEDNTFLYPTSALSSHAVNSIFGKISILEIKIGRNSTIYPGIIIGPGAEVKEQNVIYPNTVLHKNWRGKPNEFYYYGSPGRPIDKKFLVYLK